MCKISQSQLRPSTDPGDGWYIIDAAGDHPNDVSIDGEKVHIIQHLTPEVFSRIVENGVPSEGLPVDRDHLSLAPDNPTEALGWVRKLALCGDDLAGFIEWTSVGLPLIKGRVYKHFSTVYPLGDIKPAQGGSFEPEKLVGLALTNQPNNRTGQPPITNRGKASTQTANNDKTMNDIEPIKAELGLDPEASIEDVISAIQTLKGIADEASASEAETLLNSEGLDDLPDDDKEEIKEGLATNRSLALLTIRAIKEARAAANNVPNARRYSGNTVRSKTLSKADIVNRAKVIANSERASGRSCSFWKALAMAKRESK